MNYAGSSLLLVSLTLAAAAAADPDPASTTAPKPIVVPLSNRPAPPATPPAILRPAPGDGIVPDPAASSVQPQTNSVRPPTYPALPPTNPGQPLITVPPAPNCDTADCRKPGDKLLERAAKKKAAPVRIGPPAERALVESHNWAENPAAMPTRDPSGRMTFIFNESAPTIVCAPLHICDIELQPGEVVQGAPHIGDAVRWKVSPAVSGSGENKVTHLIVKPTESGLDTNMLVATDRRTYHLRLVSSSRRHVSSIGFTYPGEDQNTWGDAFRGNKGSAGGDSEMPTVAVNLLNFNYRIKVTKGKPAFKPLRAMDDGYHTYIAMNENLPQQEAPVLIGIGPGGEERMINYRVKGNLYVIDGTVAKIAFLSGVGRKQERIELTREPCKRRGWLGICWDARE